MKRLAVAVLALILLTGCARAAESSLQDVVDGLATPEQYVRAVVTDVRSAGELLVELSSGDVTVWATGFEERPGRGTEVWTAILGSPSENELVGLTYPSAGALEPPEVGLTDVGVLAVLLAALAGLAVLVPAVSAGVLRMRPRRRCPSCRGSCMGEWVTCANCGKSLAPPPAGGGPVRATVMSRRAPEPVEADALEPNAGDQFDSPEPARSTRIFHRDA